MFLSSLLSVVMLTAVTPSKAEQAIHTVSSVNIYVSEMAGPGNHVYYSCDTLEDLTSAMLKKMGAFDIRVSCSGGLDNGTYWGPATVRASFAHAVRSTGQDSRPASYRSVTMKDFDNCHAAQEIFAGLKPKLDLSSVSGEKSWCGPQDSYRIDVSALMFN